MLSINTNISSYIAQRSLNNSTQLLNQAIERMTTGYKLNHASDNAANYSISTNQTTKLSAYQVAEDNASMGLDLLTTANDSLSLISDHLTRIRDLATQAANGTYGEQSLKAINAEVNARLDEIERLYKTTEYNGVNLFNSTSINLSTTLEEIGVNVGGDIEVKNSQHEVVGTFYIDKNNSIQDLFQELAKYDINGVLEDGKINLSSSKYYYALGDPLTTLDIKTTRGGSVYLGEDVTLDTLLTDAFGCDSIVIGYTDCLPGRTVFPEQGYEGVFSDDYTIGRFIEQKDYMLPEFTGRKIGSSGSYTFSFENGTLSLVDTYDDGVYLYIRGMSYYTKSLVSQMSNTSSKTLGVSSSDIEMQIGINSDENSRVLVNTSFSLSDIANLRNIGLDKEEYFSTIDNILSTISSKQVEYGACQNRLESALDEISTHYENLASSRSTLKDADIAKVSSEYIRQQILQQASATLMSTANQTPAIALQLL